MRETSQYELECICGQHIVTAEPTFQCPKCHRRGEIEWQAKLPVKPKDNLREMRRTA